MAISQSFLLVIASTIFGTIFIAGGVNAILRPEHALSFFELSYPSVPSLRPVIDALMLVYGVRDIFMGLAMYATAYFDNKEALGWIVIAGSAVAFADGIACKVYVGKGEWGHWGYAPMLTVVGGLLAGIAR